MFKGHGSGCAITDPIESGCLGYSVVGLISTNVIQRK